MTPWGAVERLTYSHYLGAFDCGDDWMNTWVRADALKDDKAARTAVHVATDTAGTVVALYALNHGQIEIGGGGQSMAAVQLDRLALQKNHRGKTHGTDLLWHACRAASAAADLVPAKHFVVEAINEPVALWYELQGFTRYSKSLWLSMSMRSLRATLVELDRMTAAAENDASAAPDL